MFNKCSGHGGHQRHAHSQTTHFEVLMSASENRAATSGKDHYKACPINGCPATLCRLDRHLRRIHLLSKEVSRKFAAQSKQFRDPSYDSVSATTSKDVNDEFRSSSNSGRTSASMDANDEIASSSNSGLSSSASMGASVSRCMTSHAEPAMQIIPLQPLVDRFKAYLLSVERNKTEDVAKQNIAQIETIFSYIKAETVDDLLDYSTLLNAWLEPFRKHVKYEGVSR